MKKWYRMPKSKIVFDSGSGTRTGRYQEYYVYCGQHVIRY